MDNKFVEVSFSTRMNFSKFSVLKNWSFLCWDAESLTILLFIKNINILLGWAVEIFQCSVNNNMTDLYHISSCNKTEKGNAAPIPQTITAWKIYIHLYNI